MTLATTWVTSNTSGIDLTAVYAALANSAGTFGENVQPYPPVAVGTKVSLTNGGTAIYVKLGTGGVTGTGYALVAPLNDYTAAVMMSNSVGNLGDPVGFSLNSGAALVNDCVWMQTSGLCASVQVAASCVHNVVLASTATAGIIDDSVSTPTKNITGVVITTTVVGAGSSPGELLDPRVGTTN